MKNKLLQILLLLELGALAAFGQLTTTPTTITAAITPTSNPVCVASATGVVLPSVTAAGSYFVVDAEAMQVTGSPSTLCYNVRRGALGTAAASHANAETAWVGSGATGTGDSSRPFSGGAIVPTPPVGYCSATAQYTLPVVVAGSANGGRNGSVYTCTPQGLWGQISAFYVPPTQCGTAQTTSTSTNTYVPVGASHAFVMNSTSNAAAGTTTLVCNIAIPTNVTTSTGAYLTDITLFVGSQTTAPTSLGTATLGSVTFPAAATSETPSTVTPVTVGGTVTTTSPTAITTVTTAGAFLTIQHTFSATIQLSSDRQILLYTMPFLQSAAAVMTINTPGLLVHYVAAPAITPGI